MKRQQKPEITTQSKQKKKYKVPRKKLKEKL